MSISIEPLSGAHEREPFCCGNAPELDEYLKRYATANMRSGSAATFVARREGSAVVIGYYTLSATAIQLDLLQKRTGLPNPVPAALLGRLAVDQTCQGMGIGKLLLIDALKRSHRASADVAAHCVVLHARDDDARNFYLRFGFAELGDDPHHLFISMKAIAKLP